MAKRASSPTGRGGAKAKKPKAPTTLPPSFLPRDAKGRFVRLLDYKPPKSLPKRFRKAVQAAKTKERARVAALARRAEEERRARRAEAEKQRRERAKVARKAVRAAIEPPTAPSKKRLTIGFAEEAPQPELPLEQAPEQQAPSRRSTRIPALPGETEQERQRRLRRERRRRETELLQEQRRLHREERRISEEAERQAKVEREMRAAYEVERAFAEAERDRQRARPKETPVSGLPGMRPREEPGPAPVLLPTMSEEQVEERLSGRIATPEEILEMALRETRDQALTVGLMQPFVPESVLTRNTKNLSLGQAVTVGQMLNEPDVGANVAAVVQDVAEQIQAVEGNVPVYVSIRITEIMPVGVHVGSIDRIVAEGSIGTVIESWQGVAAESAGRVRTPEQLARAASRLLSDLHRNRPRAMAYIEGVFVRSRGRRND